MAKVNYISTTTIQLEKYDHTKIELSPWDLQLLFVRPMQFGLFYQKPKSSPQTIINDLKVAFARTLELFPHLVGRLAITDNEDKETSSFHIDCNNAGALFAHAEANVTISEILTPLHAPPILRDLFILNDMYNHESISQPLLAAQITELVDGLFISCTMNHAIGDGTTLGYFFNYWAETFSGSSYKLPHPPISRRWFPEDINTPIRIPKSSLKFGETKFIYPPLEERVFHFPKENIAALKMRVNAEMSTTNISSLQTLLAHLWRGIVRSRGTDLNEEVRFVIPIDSRPRLEPALPMNYIGSAVAGEAVTTSAGDLLSHNLGWAALEINKVLAQHTDSRIRSFLKSWTESPYLYSFENNDIQTYSSTHFSFYFLDFGWGKPVAGRCGPAQKTDGGICIFAGVEDGSIDISVCLLPKDLLALGKDEEFMDVVTHQDITKLLVA